MWKKDELHSIESSVFLTCKAAVHILPQLAKKGNLSTRLWWTSLALLLRSIVIHPGHKPQFESPVFSDTEVGGFSELTLDKL